MMKQENIAELFDLKQKFLRLIPHPKLILSARKKASRYTMQSEQITEMSDVELGERDAVLNAHDFLNQRITEELSLKHRIALANTFDELEMLLSELFKFQVSLCLKLQAYLPKNSTGLNDQDIKMSEPFDLYEIYKTIKSLGTDKEVREKIAAEIKDTTFEKSAITKACLRANKIIRNG
ncbi:MAG: hypothetical protein ACPG21_08730 [Crocinitomicaceae bacterium]